MLGGGDMPCQRCEELERQLRIARAELAEARHWNEEWRALAAVHEKRILELYAQLRALTQAGDGVKEAQRERDNRRL